MSVADPIPLIAGRPLSLTASGVGFRRSTISEFSNSNLKLSGPRLSRASNSQTRMYSAMDSRVSSSVA